jgi:hypothetical protein
MALGGSYKSTKLLQDKDPANFISTGRIKSNRNNILQLFYYNYTLLAPDLHVP